MRAGALLDDGHRAPDRAQRLEISQQDHGVGEIGHIDRRLHVADQPMLRHRHERRGPAAVQILQQFVHMQDEGIFFRHRGLIAVEAVDYHGLDLVLVDPLADAMGELAGRQFRGVDLIDEKLAAALHLLEVDAEALHAREQKTEFFVKHEQCRLFAAGKRRDDEDDDSQRLSGTRGPEDQRTGAGFDAAAQELVERRDAAGHGGA